MEVRDEQPNDLEAIHRVNVLAFGREGEAELVDQLRDVTSTLSFVAIAVDQIVGHIFFSPVSIAGQHSDDLKFWGLAPVAVLPEYQRQGIGALLIQHGLAECARLNIQAVAVLGSPAYYPRFGFIPAKQKGLRCEYTVPDEAFMVMELFGGGLDGCSGLVKYRPEFNALE